MPQIVLIGADRAVGQAAAIALQARGNSVVAVDTATDLIQHWQKSFGISTRPLTGDPDARAAWTDALSECDVVVCCLDVQQTPAAQGIGVGALPALLDAMRESTVRRLVLVLENTDRSAQPPLPSEQDVADLEWTVLRIGRPMEGYGTNRIALGAQVPLSDIPANDAASAAIAVLETPGTAGFDWSVAPGDLGPRRAARMEVEAASRLR